MLMMPWPRLRVKNIWPAATSQTVARLSWLKSGFHMKPMPAPTEATPEAGWPRVSTRTARMMPKMKRTGMPILASTSMPLEMPLRRK